MSADGKLQILNDKCIFNVFLFLCLLNFKFQWQLSSQCDWSDYGLSHTPHRLHELQQRWRANHTSPYITELLQWWVKPKPFYVTPSLDTSAMWSSCPTIMWRSSAPPGHQWTSTSPQSDVSRVYFKTLNPTYWSSCWMFFTSDWRT